MSSSLEQYDTAFNALLNEDVRSLGQRQKEQQLQPLLQQLHEHHCQRCPEYRRIALHHHNITDYPVVHHQPQKGREDVQQSSELPYLAVRLFKHLDLASIPQNDVYKTLYSSGTTSQVPAKVVLDKATSARQSKVLVKILQGFIGKARLPMLIIDSPNVVNSKQSYSARGAGIQGLSFFGRDHTYALNSDMTVNWQALTEFCENYQNKPVLIFGFTFMVWQYWINAIKRENASISLPKGVLVHSGGWKKLEAEKVSNDVFKAVLNETTGVQRVHNFYGMAEQVGSIFVECEKGHLHTPVFADIEIRNPFTLESVGVGQQGLIQVISTLPTSYPGHSILTEDLGELLGVDDCECGRKGKYFKVDGRLPKTEVRGCSDTHQ